MSDETLPNKGDKLYRCWNGELDVVRFVCSQILPGATGTTYTCRQKDGRRFVCSTTMYHRTELAAYTDYLTGLAVAITDNEKHLAELQQSIREMHDSRDKIEQIVESLKRYQPPTREQTTELVARGSGEFPLHSGPPSALRRPLGSGEFPLE